MAGAIDRTGRFLLHWNARQNLQRRSLIAIPWEPEMHAVDPRARDSGQGRNLRALKGAFGWHWGIANHVVVKPGEPRQLVAMRFVWT
jgi:hypothetical protein